MEAGLVMLTSLEFVEAFEHLKLSEIDPRIVIAFFPELVSKSSTFDHSTNIPPDFKSLPDHSK